MRSRGFIVNAPKENALGPDGFIGIFFSSWRDIIKQDLCNVVQLLFHMNQHELHLLNQAYVVLVPKKKEPLSMADYRPISLSHSFVKIISKLLANRLAPKLGDLISTNQTAIIKKRCIHDNFMYVQ
jgi:hypothetical protein